MFGSGGGGDGEFRSLTNVGGSTDTFGFSGGGAASSAAGPFSLFGSGCGGEGGFSSLTNVTSTAHAPHSHSGTDREGFGTRRRGSILRVGGSAMCMHAAGTRTSFAPDTKTHDGTLLQHALFDALVGAMTYGEMAPGTSPAPGHPEVLAMSDYVYKKYTHANPAICAYLTTLGEDLVNKLRWAKHIDDQNALHGEGFRPAAVPVLGGGGGSVAILRSAHLPAIVFMQTLLKLASALHPAV